ILRNSCRWLLGFGLLVLPAVAGIVLHYPAYRLIGQAAKRVARNDDTMLSTAKILGAMLFFPLTWGVAAGLAWHFGSGEAALATLLIAPLTAGAALLFTERMARFEAAARALLMFWRRRDIYERLVAEREEIREEIVRMGEAGGEA